jgi:allantoate deiminase
LSFTEGERNEEGRISGKSGTCSSRGSLMEVQSNRIQRDIEIINSFNATPERGITRYTFSEQYLKARNYVNEELKKIGAYVSTTIAGNVRGRLEGSEEGRPAVMMGSHIDSVFQGGRFDGVAGVVSAMEVARVIAGKKISHRYPIDVVVFAEEEGARFGSVMIGSRAWIGQLGFNDLQKLKDKDGVSYVEAMERCGIVPDDPSILKLGAVKTMLELHIEQSLILESKGLQIGVVEGINGIRQFEVTINGISNHAGATPMALRHDALQGAVRIIAAVEEIAARDMGKNTVATVGFLNCEPGQANVIPGKVQFTIDIRDLDSNRLDKAAKRVMAVIQRTCDGRGLNFETKSRSDTPPVVLSKDIVHLMEEIARKRKIKTLRMPSGALHDSSILPEITEVGMIFVPSKDGRSHCPEEYTNLEDIKAGADILLDAIIELAT